MKVKLKLKLASLSVIYVCCLPVTKERLLPSIGSMNVCV